MRSLLSFIAFFLIIPLVYSSSNYYYVVNLVSCSNPGTLKPGAINYCSPYAKYKVGFALVNDLSNIVNPLNYTVNGGIGPSSGCPTGTTNLDPNSQTSSCSGVAHPNNPGTYLETTKDGFRANITINYGDNVTFTMSSQDSNGIDYHPFQLCLDDGCGAEKQYLRFNESKKEAATADPRGLSQIGTVLTFQFNRRPSPITHSLNKIGTPAPGFGNYIYYFGSGNAAKYLGGSITVLNIPDSAPVEDDPLPISTYWHNYNLNSGVTSLDGLTGYMDATTAPSYNFPGVPPSSTTPINSCNAPADDYIVIQLADCLSVTSDNDPAEAVSKRCRQQDFTYNFLINNGGGFQYPYKYTYTYNKDDGAQPNILTIPYKGNDPTRIWGVTFCLLGNADACPFQVCVDSIAGDCGPLTTNTGDFIFNPTTDSNGDKRADKGLRLNGDKQILPKNFAQDVVFHFGCATRAGLGGLIRFSAATRSTLLSVTISLGCVVAGYLLVLLS